MVQRKNKNNANAKFRRASKEYYGLFESGLLEDDHNLIFSLSFLIKNTLAGHPK